MPLSPQPVYFHGIPGGSGELHLFGDEIGTRTKDIFVLNRNEVEGADGETRYKCLAERIQHRFPDCGLHLIGFSLGASAALRVASHLGDQVEQVDLISAAAPLDAGKPLDEMAGAAVFKLASERPALFKALSMGQSALASIAPSFLYRAIFSSAQGADEGLRSDAHFKETMLNILRDCLGANRQTYNAEIFNYVEDWSSVIDLVRQPVSLFHGIEDNWSPVQMASRIAEHVPNCAGVQLLEGLSHYSTLQSYLERF